MFDLTTDGIFLLLLKDNFLATCNEDGINRQGWVVRTTASVIATHRQTHTHRHTYIYIFVYNTYSSKSWRKSRTSLKLRLNTFLGERIGKWRERKTICSKARTLYKWIELQQWIKVIFPCEHYVFRVIYSAIVCCWCCCCCCCWW